MLKPILSKAMWKMQAKNPLKYPASKYAGELPEFVMHCMWLINVAFPVSNGLPNSAKTCIHFEMKMSDYEIFKNIFHYMTISKEVKKLFGEFACFYKGPQA